MSINEIQVHKEGSFNPPQHHRVLKLLAHHNGETFSLATKARISGHTTHIIGISTREREKDLVERNLAELRGLYNFLPEGDQAAARVMVHADGQCSLVVAVVVNRQFYAMYRVPIPTLDDASNAQQTGRSPPAQE